MKFRKSSLLLAGLLLVFTFVSAAGYFASNPNLLYGQPQSVFVTEETNSFNTKMCQEGQDFVLQIAPFGCEPAIVRSDLLEEQDVPVFCEISALKINPLMDINTINSMQFGSQYPKEVRTIGFYPSRVALGQSEKLNNMNSQGVGYAMIMLRAQPNESAMPDFVSGNLKAIIKYDIKNSFGIRDSSFYLPVLSEEDWENKMVQYSFWQGRGYLRAEDVTDTGATIAVYSDRYETSFLGGDAGSNEKDKILTRNLQVNQISDQVYLPGFDCLAGLQLKLNSIENANTFVRLKVNSDYMEVKVNEYFLENKCRVTEINKAGLSQDVKIYCTQDNTATTENKFELMIAPTVRMSVNDKLIDFSVGDKLYDGEEGEKVYLGYIDSESGLANKEDLYVYVVMVPNGGERLDQATLKSVSNYAHAMRTELGNDNFGRKLQDLAGKGTQLALERLKQFAIGDNIFFVSQKGEFETISGKKVRLIDFAGAVNVDENNATLSEYYKLAKEDYLSIKENFAKEKYPNDAESFIGEEALYNLMELAKKTSQNKDVLDFCKDFEELYPNSDYLLLDRIALCEDEYLSSSKEVSTHQILVGGNYYDVTLGGISEPQPDDFGIDIWIKGPNGVSKTYESLRKNQVIYLDEFRAIENQIFSKEMKMKKDLAKVTVYFSFRGNSWKWKFSDDEDIDWQPLKKTGVNSLMNSDEAGLKFVNTLNTLNLVDGVKFIQANGGDGREYIQLKDLTQESALLDVNTKSTGTFSSISKSLTLNAPYDRDGYSFVINKIYLKQYAKVSLISNTNYVSSEANFSFNIGIDKRLIQLSPEKAAEKIENLNKTVVTMEKISNTLGKVVDVFDKTCQYTGAALTLKNLITNAEGKSLARKKVMTDVGGWNDYCKAYESLGEGYISVEDCLFDNADKIDAEVDSFYSVMESQNAEAKRIQDMPGVTMETGLLGEKKVNTSAYMKIYSENVLTKIGDVKNNKGEIIETNDVQNILSYASWESKSYSLNQLREIELYSNLLKGNLDDETKKEYETKLFNLVSDAKKNYEVNENRITLSGSLNIDQSQIGFLTLGKDMKEIPYEGLKAKDLKDLAFVKTDENWGDDLPVYVFSGSDGKSYFVLLDDSSGKFEMPIKRDVDGKLYVYDLNGRLKSYPQEFDKIYFKKYDKKSYQNSYKVEPLVQYYEEEPYKGLPAIVPFDKDDGWYAYVPQTLPLGRAMTSYDSSGAVNSFWVCNIGENRLEDGGPKKGDDICEQINKGINQPYNQFPGLEKEEASKIIKRAENAILDASKGYKEGSNIITIDGDKKFKVGSPLVGEIGLACTDFMSPKDCQLLFNVCDPVICPRTRCDFGGAYPVKDVVQSGIIGSIALCLPNAKEGIKVPVCLSGVEAGVDSLTSVFKSYQSCLQESIDTGKTVGICDEIHSIYLCEFLWKQALPLGKIAIPKLTSLILGQNSRGGGEYSGFQAAWSNAKDSVSYFTNYYAVNAFNAFKARSTEEVGGAVCKNFISVVYPNSFGNLGDLSLSYSPSQFNGRFEEIPFTTVTNPPVSQYKVYFHIYAGKDRGAYYKVWLRGDSGSSFYQSTGGRIVASDYIPVGEYATQTVDFTAPAGFKELCINVNGQEECGFGQVTTSFASDWLKDQYIKSQLTDIDVASEADCISGSRNWYTLLNPNIQAGVENTIDPAIYNDAIIRICATNNPGEGSDVYIDTNKSRWIEVGTCGDSKIKCYLDTQSIDKATEFETTANQVSKELSENFNSKLLNAGVNENEFSNELKKIKDEMDSDVKINLIQSLSKKVFNNNQKAYLLLLEGDIYSGLAVKVYDQIILKRNIANCENKIKKLGLTGYNCQDEDIRDEIDMLYDKYIKEKEAESEIISRSQASCGEKILNLGISKIGEDTTRFVNGRKVYDHVCATFVSNVLIEAGSLPNFELCDESIVYRDAILELVSLFKKSSYSEIVRSEWEKGLKSGDILIWGGTGDYDKEFQHITIFESYSDGIGAKVVHDAGENRKISSTIYPNIFGSNWYVTHVWRANSCSGETTTLNKNGVSGDMSNCIKYLDNFKTASKMYGVPLWIIAGVAYQESKCIPNAQRGSSYGLMQISSQWWLGEYGLSSKLEDFKKDTMDPSKSINAGVQILKEKYQPENDPFIFNGCADEYKNKKYFGWNASLRRYNGEGCNLNYPKQDEYVEDILANNASLMSVLFGEVVVDEEIETQKNTFLDMSESPIFEIDNVCYKFFDEEWHWNLYCKYGMYVGKENIPQTIRNILKDDAGALEWHDTKTFEIEGEKKSLKDLSKEIVKELQEFNSYPGGLNYLIKKSEEVDKNILSFGTTYFEKDIFEVKGFLEVDKVYFYYSERDIKWKWSYKDLNANSDSWNEVSQIVDKNNKYRISENELKFFKELENINNKKTTIVSSSKFLDGASYLFNINLVDYNSGDVFYEVEEDLTYATALSEVRKLSYGKDYDTNVDTRRFFDRVVKSKLLSDEQILDISGEGNGNNLLIDFLSDLANSKGTIGDIANYLIDNEKKENDNKYSLIGALVKAEIIDSGSYYDHQQFIEDLNNQGDVLPEVTYETLRKNPKSDAGITILIRDLKNKFEKNIEGVILNTEEILKLSNGQEIYSSEYKSFLAFGIANGLNLNEEMKRITIKDGFIISYHSTLFVHNVNIKDISYLSNLKKLEELFLASNEITDISSLTKLSELNYLDISDNCLSENYDYSYFENKLAGKYFDYSGNPSIVSGRCS